VKHFQVRNWTKFQHYKNRNPPWIKLHTELLENYEFARLPDASKLLALCIWLLAARSDNRIPADPAWIQSKCNLKSKPDLQPLLDGGFIEWIQSLPSAEHIASTMLADCQQSADSEERRGETEAERASAVKRPSKRVPEDFTPDLAYASAQIPDIDAEAEAQKFRDWEFAKPRSDWPAVWRTWIRNCKDRGQYTRREQTKWM
jgi:hypothetical protein